VPDIFRDEVAKIAMLDAVITVIDVHHIELHLDEIKPDGVQNEAIEQITFADRILLNKRDRASEVQLQAIEKRIKSINATV
jgi:G3E family GTPase